MECNLCGDPSEKSVCEDCLDNYRPTDRQYVSQDEYKIVYRYQHGRCIICLRKKSLISDHLHGPELFRGLLCVGCNSGIGLFQDRPSLLYKAANYLHERGNPEDMIQIIRSLTEDDLPILQGPPSEKKPAPMWKIRAGHHMVAKKIACGLLLTEKEAEYAFKLRSDPSFKNLVACYKEELFK